MTSPPPSPAMPKYKLAEYRYGREEMLALYVKDNKVSSFPTFYSWFYLYIQNGVFSLQPTNDEIGKYSFSLEDLRGALTADVDFWIQLGLQLQ